MKNKKGFTLVEIAISVSLLSLVMVFMIKFVSIIRTDEDSISLETDMLLTKSIVSKTINEDIKDESGITSISCANNKCTISLKSGKNKTLEITDEGTTLLYKDITNNKIEFTRKLPNNYVFSLNKEETNYLYIIEINIDSHPEYNVEIVDKKS